MNDLIGPWANHYPAHQPWVGPQPCGNPYRDLPAPKLAAVIEELHKHRGVPPGIALFAALAAMSLSMQGLYDVQIPGGQVSRIALYLLTIAGSGQGKTTALKFLLDSHFKLQEKHLEQHAAEIRRWEEDNRVWEQGLRGLEQALRRARNKGNSGADEEEAIRDHLALRPLSPRKGQFLFEDATMAALLYALYQNGISAGLISSEGGSILYGEALKEPPKLNALFSGETLIVDRKNAPSFVLKDVGFTLGVMCQPDVLADYLGSKRGQKAKATGLNARLLVSNVQPCAMQPAVPDSEMPLVHCDAFNQRMAELMARTLRAVHVDGMAREVLRFTPEAAARFGEVRGKIRRDMLADGLYARAQDHAARLPEILCRLAAVIHVGEGYAGDIGLPALEAAITIAHLSSHDYLGIFVPPSKEVLDADAVHRWLWNETMRLNVQAIDRTHLINLGPVRKARALDTALAVLNMQNRVAFARHGRTTYIAPLAPRTY